jgi:glycerol uptake facilitator protein
LLPAGRLVLGVLEKERMADTDAGARPVGETIGRRATQMDNLRAGVLGEALAEFLGTFVLIAFGDGVVAMAVAALNQSGRAQNNHTIFLAAGDWLLITWGWAIAVTMAVYVAGGVTGAHINPAVTFGFAVRGEFPWRKVPWYWLAQVAGAFVGAALVFLVYYAAIGSYENANHITRGDLPSVVTYSIFATFPAPYFTGGWIGPLVTEITGTAFLLMFVAALSDRRNLAPLSNLTPWLVGLAVAAIGMSYGANSGYAINPARDFGPRLFAFIAGWGQVALPGNGPWFSNYFWIPIVGPLVGGAVGITVYDFIIKNVLVARGVTEAES